MTSQFYIQLAQDFCEANQNYCVGASCFGYGITKDGRYFTSTNAFNDFPELFTGDEPIIKLSQSDF